MFGHILISRLKCMAYDRPILFWTLLYPLVLSTFFWLAFSNLSTNDTFKSIPVGVVVDEGLRRDVGLLAALDAVSEANDSAASPLFHIVMTPEEKAIESLKQNEIKGYIIEDMDGGPRLVVKSSGIEQTIIKQFLDSYIQTSSAYSSIAAQNSAPPDFIDFGAAYSYVENIAPNKSSSGNTVIFFYGLIAMAVMFGGFWGRDEVMNIQADQSPKAARLNLVPVHKLKIFTASLLAAVIVQFIELLVLVAYIAFVLGVDFGTQFGLIIVICFFGSIIGVSWGALIGSLIKNSNVGQAILIAVSLLLSSLTGLFSVNMKYAVMHAVPAISWINPASLVSDAFYSLYYYSGHTRVYLNIAMMAAVSTVFCLGVYLVTRRRKYASI